MKKQNMSPHAPKRKRTDSERRAIMRKFHASGLSIRAFSQKYDVAQSNLAKWKQRYGEAVPSQAAFVELESIARPSQSGEFDYELALAGGRVLRLRRGFDRREIETLVATLSRGC